MNDNAHQVPRYMGFSPMMSPMSNFGFMGHMMPPPMSPAQVVPGHFVRPGPPTSPSTTSQSPKQNSQVTPPHQTRGHFPQYMPVYPYGMFSPYYYSWLWILSECFIFLILWARFLSRHFVNKIVKSPVLRHWILIMCKYVDMYKHLLYSKRAFALYILLYHYFFTSYILYLISSHEWKTVYFTLNCK